MMKNNVDKQLKNQDDEDITKRDIEQLIAKADNLHCNSPLTDTNKANTNIADDEIKQWFANANNFNYANASEFNYLDLANYYYNNYELVSAIKFYQEAISELDNNKEIYNASKYAEICMQLGICYFCLKKYDEAEKITIKAIEVSPNKLANFYKNLGIVQVELAETKTINKDKCEKYLLAIGNFQQALKINPQDKIASRNISEIYSLISKMHQEEAKYFNELGNNYFKNKQFENFFQCFHRTFYHNNESVRCCSEAIKYFENQLPPTTSFTQVIQVLGQRANKKRKGVEVNNNEADCSKRECLKKLRM